MLANPYLQIHLCVLLWGFTAILGKLISLHAIPLVFWRVVIVSLCLLLWLPVWRQLARLSRRDLGLASANGVLITLHWLCFYGSIKTSNASVAATCMTFAPAFLSLIEPVMMRQAFKSRDLLVAVAAIPGVGLVVGGIPADMYVGLALGALAAFLAAAFSLVNKNLALRAPALGLTTIEMSTGALLLGVLIPFWPALGADFVVPGRADFAWLAILAIACTLIPFALTLVALRKLSAFSVQLAVNLEPVYAILLATALLGEGAELRWPFYLGVALILAAVLGHALLLKSASATARA
jgi:drug/metabolite transporter (DMT)-like permease